MPDFPTSRPVLAGKPALRSAQITLEALPEGHLLQVIGTTTRDELAAALSAAGLSGSSLHSAGYRQWYVAGDQPLASTAIGAFAHALPARTHVSDQSHGRVRIRLSGPRAAQLLAKGTAVDLHPSAFAEGNAAITLFGHISIHLARTGAEDFELTVLRSFAEALYEELHDLALSVQSTETAS